MSEEQANHTLEDVLDELSSASEEASGTVSVDDILEMTGRRSFGLLLLVPALMAFTPLGGIPGVPTIMAAIVILIAGQLVFGARQFWIPKFVRRQAAERETVRKAVGYLVPVARLVDRLQRPRLAWLAKPPFLHFTAVLCIAVALTFPPLEVVPFGGTLSWAAIAAFALSLMARDGLFALIAFGFALGAGYLVFTTIQ